jgi:hypothetical protein
MSLFSSRLSHSALVAALVAIAPAAVHAGYTITPLNFSGLSAGDEPVAVAVNNGVYLLQTSPGGVAGTSYLFNSATNVYTALPSDPLALPGSTDFVDLNSSGQLVGSYQPTDLGTYQSFEYSGGVFTNITPPAAYQQSFSDADAINDAGDVVGVWETSSGHEQGFELSGGVYTTIDAPPYPDTASTLYGINDDGAVVGVSGPIPGGTTPLSGFEESGGIFTTINYLSDVVTVPITINDNGEIVGLVSTDPDEVTADGLVDIGGILTTLDYPGADYTALLDVDNAGQILGYYQDADGTFGSFLATPTSTVPDGAATAGLFGVALLGLGCGRRRLARKPNQ